MFIGILRDKLYNLIYSTSGQKFEQVKYAGGNSISILNYMGETFTNKDFSETILRNAIFEGGVCDNSSFSDAELQDSSFIDSSMLYVNLENSKLEGALFEGIGQITAMALDKRERNLAFGTINEMYQSSILKILEKFLA
ncbi:MAG: pentapeptide repeat-containing protein [Methanothrix sp.]|nr:pentapeptide repeat-containing protein [Methanothrix sp.]